LRREDLDRRRFLGTVAASAAAIPAFGARAFAADPQPAPKPSGEPPVRFAVVGINHAHIYGQTDALLRAGGELVALYAEEPDLVAAFQKKYPQARLARTEAEILDDPKIALVLSSAIPDQRAPLGIRVM
jgi:hypothetical protein